MSAKRPTILHRFESDIGLAMCAGATNWNVNRACVFDDKLVTCKLCVYRLWRAGRIADGDSRITDNMREHRKTAEANAVRLLTRRALGLRR